MINKTRRVDRMRKVRVYDDYNQYEDDSVYACVHGVFLEDHGSCELPEGHTITREEWLSQQQEDQEAA